VDAGVHRRFAEMGQEIPPPDQQTPSALAEHQRAELAKWGPIINAAGLKAE